MLTVFNHYGNNFYGLGPASSVTLAFDSKAQLACTATNTFVGYHNGSYGAWALATQLWMSQSQTDPAPAGFYYSDGNFTRYWDGFTLGYPYNCLPTYFGWSNRNDGVPLNSSQQLQGGPGHGSSDTPNPFIGTVSNFYGTTSQSVKIGIFTYNQGTFTGSYEYEGLEQNAAGTDFNPNPYYSSGLLNITTSNTGNGSQNLSNAIFIPGGEGLKIKCYQPDPLSYMVVYGWNAGSNSTYMLP